MYRTAVQRQVTKRTIGYNVPNEIAPDLNKVCGRAEGKFFEVATFDAIQSKVQMQIHI
jgi:hypothetical protein